MIGLIEQSQMAVEELIDCLGRPGCVAGDVEGAKRW